MEFQHLIYDSILRCRICQSIHNKPHWKWKVIPVYLGKIQGWLCKKSIARKTNAWVDFSLWSFVGLFSTNE
jgi:hypothetical protein